MNVVWRDFQTMVIVIYLYERSVNECQNYNRR